MGDRLEQARQAAGFESAADAARALGIPYGTYSVHENGARGFKARSAARYAYFYKVRLEWLLTGHGPMKAGNKPPVLEMYEALPPERQREAMRYLMYLKEQD